MIERLKEPLPQPLVIDSGAAETVMPSNWFPGHKLEESCAYDYLSCGARAVGMTHGYPDFVGSEAPDRHFMVTGDVRIQWLYHHTSTITLP